MGSNVVPPRVVPWYIVTLSPTIAVSPITTPIPWSINNPLPIFAPGCISIPVNLLALFDKRRAIVCHPFLYNLCEK